MRLLHIFLLMLIGMGQIANAQIKQLDRKVTVRCHNMSGKEFLEYLRMNQQVHFSYSDNLVASVNNITLTASDKPLIEVLEQAFQGTDVGFREVAGQILLTKNPKAPKKVDKKPEPGSGTKSTPANPEILQKYEEVNVDMQSAKTEEELDDTYLKGKTSLYTEYIKVQEDSSGEEVSKKDLKSALRALKRDLARLRDSIRVSKEYVQLNESLKELNDSLKASKVYTRLNEGLRLNEKTTSDSASGINENDQTPHLFPDTTSSADGTFPVQVSFIPPMSTNGIKNSESVNILSMNILAGYSKGLDGFEFGSIANIEKEKVNGFQVSGFTNVVGEDVKGVQAAGFCNIVGDRVVGSQVSGFLNLAGDSSHAFQAAGFYNQVTGSNAGGQFAGFMNLSTNSHFGPQGAGFLNVSGGNLLGFQAAGFANIASGTVSGMQASGFLNFARNMNGLQLGFLNVTGRLKGTQLGFLNIADSTRGAQIGFLSFTRKGYHKLELGTNEIAFNTLSFKTGTKGFYNILSAGIKFIDGNDLATSYGYGLGGEIPLSQKFFVAIEGACHQANDTRRLRQDLNLFANSRLLFGFSPVKKLSIVLGPTFNGNLMNASPDDYNQYSYVPDKTVYSEVFDQQYEIRNKYVSLWPGFYGGVSFNF